MTLVYSAPESNRRTLIPVIVVTRENYAILEQMLASAREKVPDMEMDSVLSAAIAEMCRQMKSNCNAEKKAPGGPGDGALSRVAGLREV
jgi:hypothetical protein